MNNILAAPPIPDKTMSISGLFLNKSLRLCPKDGGFSVVMFLSVVFLKPRKKSGTATAQQTSAMMKYVHLKSPIMLALAVAFNSRRAAPL